VHVRVEGPAEDLDVGRPGQPRDEVIGLAAAFDEAQVRRRAAHEPARVVAAEAKAPEAQVRAVDIERVVMIGADQEHVLIRVGVGDLRDVRTSALCLGRRVVETDVNPL
jgi:hypothetical protein